MSKPLTAVACALLLGAALLASDDPLRVWSQPTPPSAEALDRLNMQMDWAVHVPMDGRRDGFGYIQVAGDHLIIQTRSGLLTVLDAAHGGRALWRARPGLPYQFALPPAYNGQAVFATDSGAIYALDRRTGALQWKHDFDVALSAPVQADDAQMYTCNVQKHLTAFHLPAASTPAAAPRPPADKSAEPEASKSTPTAAPSAEEAQPFFAWDYQTTDRIDNKPILSTDSIFLALPRGGYMALPKTSHSVAGTAELYTYAGDARFSAPPGHSADAAYLSTDDAHVYAIAVDSGKPRWRYTSGTPVNRAPVEVEVSDGAAVEKDLYVTAEGKGLARLNADTGEPLWNLRGRDNSPEADRLLAVNPKFVYAADRVGRLLVLDRKNGARLSRYDVHDYVFPVINRTTDRVYLAANDGLIVCLHDKEYPVSLQYRKVVLPPTDKPLAERIQELKDKLAKPITEPEAPMPVQFRAWAENFGKKYGVKMFVSGKAFKDSMVPAPDDQMVTPAAADKKPLGEVIQGVLDQVKASYVQVEDRLVIGPAAMSK